MKKLIQSTFTAIALGLLFSIPYAAPIDAAAKVDDSLNLMTIAKLPACNVNNSGSSAAVSDYAGSAVWGSAVGTGGGTGVARVYCNGASWTVFAGGGGGTVTTTQQNFVKAAPITPNAADSSNLNYSTGCSGSPGAASSTIGDTVHNCLMFDDHWTTTPTSTTRMTTLNTANWYPGYFRCNDQGGAGNANCVQQIAFTGAPAYPWSAWCFDLPTGGCGRSIYYDWGNALPANPQPTGITNPTLNIVADGSLDMISSYYPNATIENAGPCTVSVFDVDCSVLNWVNAGITLGSLPNLFAGANPQNLPNNLNALIPASGGIFQVRMRTDAGVAQGLWGGFECDAVDDNGSQNVDGASVNANMEFGYGNHGLTSALQGYGQGMDDKPYQPPNVVVTTGDDGVGIGDLTHWHTFAIEWTGNATHQWNWYIDGHPLASAGITGHNEVGFDKQTQTTGHYPNRGFTCSITQIMTNNGEFNPALPTDGGSFASGWTPGTGPFHYYISDVQIYKKPGT